jgi:hypothetical protein
MNSSKAFLLVFCSTLFLSFSSYAQAQSVRDSLIKAYEQGSIMLQNGRYVTNGESRSLGFGQRNLGDVLKKSPLAYAEFEQFRKKRNTALGVYFAGLGVTVAGLILNRKNEDALSGGLIVGGLATTIISLPIMSKSTKHFHKSVWLYNRDVLKN